MIKITWEDNFSSEEMAELIRNKFDISVSYFEEDYDFGVKIADWDYNSKILNFIKKKVSDVSVIEESKKSIRKSIKEVSYSYNDYMSWNTFDDLVAIFEEWKDDIRAIDIKLGVNYVTVYSKDFDYVVFERENFFWDSSVSQTRLGIHIGDKIKPKFDNGEIFMGEFGRDGRITFYSK